MTSVSNKRRRKPKGSFNRALAEAKRRLAATTKRQDHAKAELAATSTEIPALQRTIAALQSQLNPKGVMPNAEQPNVRSQHAAVTGDSPSGERVSVVPEPPTEIKFMRDGVEVSVPVVPQDLSGMGSVRSGQPEVIPAATEAELPEPEGVPLAGE